MKSGIYVIENLINGKKYVGQSVDVKKRKGKYHRGSRYLNFAINKYGRENFKRYVIVYCEKWELDRLEIELIKVLHSHCTERGYNISLGGDLSFRGMEHSDETKDLMSILSSGKNNPFWGKHHSDESKKKSSESHQGENNARFGKKLSSASSKYLGVGKNKEYKDGSPRYQTTITINNKKRKYLGYFKSEIDAAKAYDKYVIENNLPNPLNFPDITLTVPYRSISLGMAESLIHYVNP